MAQQQAAAGADADTAPGHPEELKKTSRSEVLHDRLGHPLLLLFVGAVVTGLLISVISEYFGVS